MLIFSAVHQIVQTPPSRHRAELCLLTPLGLGRAKRYALLQCISSLGLAFFPSCVPALFAVRKPPISLFHRVRVVLNKARTLSLGKLGGELSGGPADKTLCSQCRRSAFDPWSWN